MTEEDELFALAIRCLGDAEERLAEASPVAHTLTPGVPAVAEPDDPARRAERRRAEAEYDERLRDARELSQAFYTKVP